MRHYQPGSRVFLVKDNAGEDIAVPYVATDFFIFVDYSLSTPRNEKVPGYINDIDDDLLYQYTSRSSLVSPGLPAFYSISTVIPESVGRSPADYRSYLYNQRQTDASFRSQHGFSATVFVTWANWEVCPGGTKGAVFYSQPIVLVGGSIGVKRVQESILDPLYAYGYSEDLTTANVYLPDFQFGYPRTTGVKVPSLIYECADGYSVGTSGTPERKGDLCVLVLAEDGNLVAAKVASRESYVFIRISSGDPHYTSVFGKEIQRRDANLFGKALKCIPASEDVRYGAICVPYPMSKPFAPEDWDGSPVVIEPGVLSKSYQSIKSRDPNADRYIYIRSDKTQVIPDSEMNEVKCCKTTPTLTTSGKVVSYVPTAAKIEAAFDHIRGDSVPKLVHFSFSAFGADLDMPHGSSKTLIGELGKACSAILSRFPDATIVVAGMSFSPFVGVRPAGFLSRTLTANFGLPLCAQFNTGRHPNITIGEQGNPFAESVMFWFAKPDGESYKCAIRYGEQTLGVHDPMLVAYLERRGMPVTGENIARAIFRHGENTRAMFDEYHLDYSWNTGWDEMAGTLASGIGSFASVTIPMWSNFLRRWGKLSAGREEYFHGFDRRKFLQQFAQYIDLPIPDNLPNSFSDDQEDWFNYLESFLDENGHPRIQIVR